MALQWLTKTNFVLGLVSLDCRLRLLKNFSRSYFLKETASSFFFLLLEPIQCLGKTFPFRHFKTETREKILSNDDINSASVL